MFRASPTGRQLDAFNNANQQLRPKEQKILNASDTWYNVFFMQVFSCIDEWLFMPLFNAVTGRPNTSVRLLVGMLIIKEGFGWSDSALFEAVRFNLTVRRALGLDNLSDPIPTLSTYYLFKQRLYFYQLKTGINLLNDVFQALTKDQVQRLGVIGEKIRMDSTLLGSNLASHTRLQLIIACLQVFWKSLQDSQKLLLGETDRKRLDALCNKSPSQLIYTLEDTTKQSWLEELGQLMLRLLNLYGPESSEHYHLIKRLLSEQYNIEEEGEIQNCVLKPAKEISADSLQSPHDEDAAYRKKKDETVQGYSVNVTETCEDGQVNLVVDVQAAPATTADNSFLQDAVENSEAVLGVPVKEVSADGAYYSDENEAFAAGKGSDEEDNAPIIHYTGFPGKPGRYEYKCTGIGIQITDRETGKIQWAEEYKPGHYRFRDSKGKWRYITDKNLDIAERRRRTENLSRELFNRRCNVEATIFQLVYHTRQKKLRYRGLFSTQLWAICRAAWINVRRIAIFQGKQAEVSA